MPDPGVRSVSSVPTEDDFASQYGPPIVVNRASGTAYVLKDDDTVAPIGGSGIPQSILDAKGDLIVASAADTAARLAVGSDGSYPRAASGATVGIEWQKNNMAASAAPGTGDDADDGYSVGSIWLDTTNDKGYICLDASAGAAVWKETTVAAGGISSGTSFPAQPAFGNNVPFLRTDRGLLYYYDGTRWLTLQQYSIELKPFSNTYVTAMSATTASRMLGVKPCPQATDFWMETGYVNGAATTAVSITNHWVLDFRALPPVTASGTTIASININTDGWVINENHQSEVTIGALLGTSITAVGLNCTEVGTSTLIIYDAKIVGRLVG